MQDWGAAFNNEKELWSSEVAATASDRAPVEHEEATLRSTSEDQCEKTMP